MLVIREAQMRVFSEAQVLRFQKAVEAHAWAQFPEQSRELGEAGVRGRVETVMRKIRQYGIRAESDALTYLEFMFVLSPDFDDRVEWAREIFQHPRMPGPRKMEMLHKRYRYELSQSQPE
jgi:hypothetical protein